MTLGPMEIGLLILAALLLFGGYKKLPDASRSLGRSLRIFKGEMKGMKSDDDLRTKDSAQATPVVRAQVVATGTPDADAQQLEAEARAAEARAAELRVRAEQARAGSPDGTR